MKTIICILHVNKCQRRDNIKKTLLPEGRKLTGGGN